MNTKRLWKSDLGDGYFRNPVLFTDYSDPDVIRVGDTFYMTASSFSVIPGLPILVSKDLINWELVNYAIKDGVPDKSYDNPRHGCGIWAPSIRYHDGKFWIFVGLPDEGIFVTYAEDPYGEWSPLTCLREAKGFIDPCPVWTEDGKAYVVHGYAKSRIGFKSILGAFEMSTDCTKVLSEDRFIFDGNETQPTIEGPKVYIRNGYIYILAPAGGVKTGWQTALRSKDIYGPYEEQIVLHQGDSYINGPHQGGLVDTPDGEEWFMHFQDRGVYGRICHLQKVEWKEGWPVMGIHVNGLTGEPATVYKKPSSCPMVTPYEPDTSDDFKNNTLGLQWQWMANKKEEYYSLEHNTLRLHCVNITNIEKPILWQCGNILTQKITCPSFIMETKLDITNVAEEGRSGVCMLGGQYSSLQFRKENNTIYMEHMMSEGENEPTSEVILCREPWVEPSNEIYVRIVFCGDGSSMFVCSNNVENMKQGTNWLLEHMEEVKEADNKEFIKESNCFMTPPYYPGKAMWTGAKTALYCINDKPNTNNGYMEVSYVHYEPLQEQNKGEDGIDPIFLTAKEGNTSMVKQLVEYSKYSLNMRDHRERGILHYAAENNIDDVEMVVYLTEQVGMDPLEGDINRITPYQLAVESNNTNIIEYFEQYVGAPYEKMYHNPIRTGAFPDPSIVRVGEDYYMVNSSFTYFPCIPISHSKDLVHWEIIGHAITDLEWSMLEGLESGRGYWAPDISYDGEHFYITATYRMNDTDYVCRKQVVVRSKYPQGPYSKPAIIDEDGIDPSIFVDEDGRKYMLLNRGARIMELNKDCTEKISDAKLLWYGHMMRAPEGPHLMKRFGYYYLIVAEGGTGIGHRVSVARSKNLYGPYESCPYNPIMRQENETAAIQRAGHGKLVETQNGEWYMVYLCGRLMDGKYTVLGRETALDPVTWTADGWPIVNNKKGPSVLQYMPNLKIQEKQNDTNWFCKVTETDSEIEVEWNKNWMWVKTPDFSKVKPLSDGGLCLYGGTPLYEVSKNQVFVTRQTDFKQDFYVKLKEITLESDGEVGVTAYYDENTYLTFGFVERNNQYYLEVRERIGEQLRTSMSESITKLKGIKWENNQCIMPIILFMKVNYGKREFYYGEDMNHLNYFGTLRNVNYLCDEGYHKGKRFTGAMFGIYVADKEKETVSSGTFELIV